MEKIKSLEIVTKEFLAFVNQQVNEKNRERFLDELTQFLDERERLMKDIKPPYTTTEQEIGKRLIELDQEIQYRLDIIFTELKMKMRSAKRQKVSFKQYNLPYRDVATSSGSYWDKKK